MPAGVSKFLTSSEPLDVDQFFIILPDAIGHGNSSKPSDASEVFPHYGYVDIVRAQHLVVNELLGIHLNNAQAHFNPGHVW
jgi:homoserine O-acetyltransferase/O-succinyltransferase